ncbi:MAG: hypothetical protein WBE68_07535 [Candidatus Nitrosopolaris sp.]
MSQAQLSRGTIGRFVAKVVSVGKNRYSPKEYNGKRLNVNKFERTAKGTLTETQIMSRQPKGHTSSAPTLHLAGMHTPIEGS